MARTSPNGRPLAGARLNDTVAIVKKGVKSPPGVYELHTLPSPEAMVTNVVVGGTRPGDSPPDPSPDKGRTFARAKDHLGRLG